MIDRLVDAGAPVYTCCRLLGVSYQGYYHRYRKRPASATELRRRWLMGVIREIRVADMLPALLFAPVLAWGVGAALA